MAPTARPTTRGRRSSRPSASREAPPAAPSPRPPSSALATAVLLQRLRRREGADHHHDARRRRRRPRSGRPVPSRAHAGPDLRWPRDLPRPGEPGPRRAGLRAGSRRSSRPRERRPPTAPTATCPPTASSTSPRINTADYRTRIVVRRPEKQADFNGTVVVEWLNVSGGLDANPEYTYARDEIVRRGDAWVGVSAQMIGIEGGAGRGARARRPRPPARGRASRHRPGALRRPRRTRATRSRTTSSPRSARALRAPDGVDVLGGLRPERVLAVGESQSAFALTTYVDGVQPLTREFDGFLSTAGPARPCRSAKPGEGSTSPGPSVGSRPRSGPTARHR